MPGTDILAGVPTDDSGYATAESSVAVGDEWMAMSPPAGPYPWTVTDDGIADGMAIRLGTAMGGPGANFTMILTDTSGNIVAITEEVAGVASSWVTADFTGSPLSVAVSVGDEFEMWFAMDAAYFQIMSDGASWVAIRDQSGTYAAPPDPLDSQSSYQGEGVFALRLMGTIGGGGGNPWYHHANQ